MNKQIGILMAVFLLGIVSVFAQTVSNVPIGDEGLTGATQFLEANETDTDNINNVSWEYKTFGGSWVVIGSVVNDSATADTQFNITWDTTGITDQGGITLNITAYYVNASVYDSVTVTGIDIDNSVPTTTYGTGTPGANSDVENESLSINTASDASIVNCTLVTSPAMNQTSSFFTAASGSMCLIQIDQISEGSYNYSWSATDGLNTSTFSSRYVNINMKGGQYVPPEEEVTTTGAQIPSKALLFVALFILVIWLWKRK